MKRRPSALPQLAIIAAYVVLAMELRSHTRWSVAGMGALAVVLAVLVEAKSAQVWKRYRRNYQPSKNKLRNLLNEPRPIYNYLNVYVLWPAVFVLGAYALYIAWHLK